MKENSFDIHAEITNRIVAAIEAGAGEFQMPWHNAANTKTPVNATSKRAYRGVNIVSLWIVAQACGYGSNEWATFKQWRERGCMVRKGEKGTPIVFYKQLRYAADANGDASENDPEKMVLFARASWVFNASQVDGYEVPSMTIPERPLFERLAAADAAIAATGFDIRHGGARAYYHRVEDYIQVPDERAFVGTATSTPQEAYYSTVLHEMAHMTGAEARLNREKGKRFGDKPYAFEEVIAELSAAYSCAELGIASTPRQDHAQYIAEWLSILKADKKAIFTAASAASAATDYIRAFSRPNAGEEAA